MSTRASTSLAQAGQGPLDDRSGAGTRTAPVVLALTIEQACGALGVSWKTWREHIEPEVKVIRVGRCKRVGVSELQRWIDEHGERAGDGL